MSFLSIDTAIFGIFLLANLILRLVAGRSVKSLRDFSIGNKDFSTATVTSTIVATWIGGGFMFYGLQNIYTKGLQFIIPLSGSAFCLLFIGQVLAVRMGEFLNDLSVAETMGKLYGTAVRTITAISGILMSIGSMAMQFKVISRVITLLLEIEGTWVTVIAAGIVILYSVFGGIRSVLITDVLQFLVFSIFIPILALVIWNQLKSPEKVVQTLTTNPIFSFRGIIGWNPQFFSSLGVMLYFMIPGMNPPIFQRIIMSKNLEQAKKSFSYAAGITFVMVLAILWLTILLVSDNANLDASKLMHYIIATYAYPGLKGLIAIGITAMAMSTADSYLNSSAVLAVNDILKPLNLPWRDSIVAVRIFSLVFGFLALVLALRTQDLLELLLLTSSFYMPIFTVPLLLAIFGFRSTTRCVLIGMVAGLVTVILWDKYLAQITGMQNLIPGMLANLICFMSSHYLLREKGGWGGIKDPSYLMVVRQKRKESLTCFYNNFKSIFTYKYLEQNLPSYEIIYSLFAIYVMGATYSSFYTVSELIKEEYAIIYKAIYHSVLVLTAAFLTYPAWPLTFKSKRFITFFWPAGIFYILFVVGILLVLMSGFNEVQVMIFLLNLMMASILLSWPIMLLLALLGIYIGYIIFNTYCGIMYGCTGIAVTGQFKFTYGVLLVSTFLTTIFRFKREKKILESKNLYLNNLYEEKNKEMNQILAYREEVLKDLSGDEKTFIDQTTASYIEQIIYRMTDYMRLEVSDIKLEKLLYEVKESLKLTDEQPSIHILSSINTKQFTIQADILKLKKLLINGILHLQQNNIHNDPIHLVVEDAKLGNKVAYMKDYIRQLTALKFTLSIRNVTVKQEDIYMIEHLPLITLTNKKNKLMENARIIHAHYGYGELNNDHIQVYVLPVNVREVRGKVMELLREPIEADKNEINHPIAISVEKEFIEKLQSTKVDIALIYKALDTIKKYHAGIKRKSGEPFFTHPIQVALILLEYWQDQDAIIAALLHDTVEDTSLSLIQIKAIFGDAVAYVVEQVTNLEGKMRRVILTDHENIYRLSHTTDKRALYVKLADRMHNMRAISGHSSLAKQKHIASETLNFFVVIAKHLELREVAEELEKLSLEVLGKE